MTIPRNNDFSKRSWAKAIGSSAPFGSLVLSIAVPIFLKARTAKRHFEAM